MAALILPRRLYSQPQGIVAVDDSAPYRESLSLAFSCAGQPFDTISQRYLTSNGTSGGNTPGVAGVAKAYLNSTSSMDRGSGFVTPAHPSNTRRQYTVLALLETTDTTNGDYHWSFGGTAGGVDYMGLRGGGAATSVQASWGQAANITYSGVPDWCDGRPHVIAMMWLTSNDRRLFIDGVQVGQSTNGLAFPNAYEHVGIGGLNRNSSELPMATKVYGLLAYNEAIDVTYLREMGTPDGFWRTFRAKPHVLYFDVTAAPSVPTLSSAMATSITATSAVPQVTLTF